MRAFNMTTKVSSGVLNNSKNIRRSPRLDRQAITSVKKAVIKSPVPKIRFQKTNESLTTYQQLLKK